MIDKNLLSASWRNALGDEIYSIICKKYCEIENKRSEGELILPIEAKDSGIFFALNTVDFEDVKVLVIGQDPYPNIEDAHGLAFSKKSGKCPASLKNIFAKIEQETGIHNVNGNLSFWAKQGVLLLNRALTFTKTESLAMRIKYWESVIDGIISKLLERRKPLVVILWGRQANTIPPFDKDVTNSMVKVIRSSHPSNMGNAKNTDIKDLGVKAFNNVEMFTECNNFLKSNNLTQIDWSTDSK